MGICASTFNNDKKTSRRPTDLKQSVDNYTDHVFKFNGIPLTDNWLFIVLKCSKFKRQFDRDRCGSLKHCFIIQNPDKIDDQI